VPHPSALPGTGGCNATTVASAPLQNRPHCSSRTAGIVVTEDGRGDEGAPGLKIPWLTGPKPALSAPALRPYMKLRRVGPEGKLNRVFGIWNTKRYRTPGGAGSVCHRDCRDRRAASGISGGNLVKSRGSREIPAAGLPFLQLQIVHAISSKASWGRFHFVHAQNWFTQLHMRALSKYFGPAQGSY